MRVTVTCVGPGDAAELLRRAPLVLDADERARVDRHREPADADAARVARVLLRTAYGAALGVDPAAVSFVPGPHGRPAVPGAGAFSANVSHTRGLVALASCPDGPVGVDVQTVGERTPAGVAERFFAPAEAELLARTADAERPPVFAVLWTVKEAVLKATGAGIGGGLDTVVVPDPPRVLTGSPVAVAVATDGRWAVRAWTPGRGHVAAVAVLLPEGPVRSDPG